jgi:hypothetical protein
LRGPASCAAVLKDAVTADTGVDDGDTQSGGEDSALEEVGPSRIRVEPLLCLGQAWGFSLVAVGDGIADCHDTADRGGREDVELGEVVAARCGQREHVAGQLDGVIAASGRRHIRGLAAGVMLGRHPVDAGGVDADRDVLERLRAEPRRVADRFAARGHRYGCVSAERDLDRGAGDLARAGALSGHRDVFERHWLVTESVR